MFLGLQKNGWSNGRKRGKCPSKNQVDIELGKGIVPWIFGNFQVIYIDIFMIKIE